MMRGGRVRARGWCGVAVVCAALAAAPASAQSGGGGLDEVLSVLPGDAAVAVVVDVGATSELLLGVGAEQMLGEGRPLTEAIDGTLARRLGVRAQVHRVGLYVGPDEEAWAVVALGAVEGTPTVTATLDYRGHTLYALPEGSGDAEVALVVPSGLAIGDLAGITAVLDAVAGSTVSLGEVPELALTGEGDASPAVLVYGGRTAAREVIEGALQVVGNGVLGGSLALSPTGAQLRILTRDATVASEVRAALEAHVVEARSFMEGRDRPEELLNAEYEVLLGATRLAATDVFDHLTIATAGRVVVLDLASAPGPLLLLLLAIGR